MCPKDTNGKKLNLNLIDMENTIHGLVVDFIESNYDGSEEKKAEFFTAIESMFANQDFGHQMTTGWHEDNFLACIGDFVAFKISHLQHSFKSYAGLGDNEEFKQQVLQIIDLGFLPNHMAKYLNVSIWDGFLHMDKLTSMMFNLPPEICIVANKKYIIGSEIKVGNCIEPIVDNEELKFLEIGGPSNGRILDKYSDFNKFMKKELLESYCYVQFIIEGDDDRAQKVLDLFNDNVPEVEYEDLVFDELASHISEGMPKIKNFMTPQDLEAAIGSMIAYSQFNHTQENMELVNANFDDLACLVPSAPNTPN